MAIANGTCVSFCNQPKGHFGLPWVRPWDNRGKCHTDEKEDSMLVNALQHVPILSCRITISVGKIVHRPTTFSCEVSSVLDER